MKTIEPSSTSNTVAGGAPASAEQRKAG